MNSSFKVICLTETWCQDTSIANNLFQLSNYSCVHQIRNDRRAGGVCIYVHNSLRFKRRNDMCTNCHNVESISVEIINEGTKNTIVNALYRPPNGEFETFKKHLNKYLKKL